MTAYVHIFVSSEYVRETQQLYNFLEENIDFINQRFRIEVHEITKSMLKNASALRDLKSRGIMRLPAMILSADVQPILGSRNIQAVLVPQERFEDAPLPPPLPADPSRYSNMREFTKRVADINQDDPVGMMDSFYSRMSSQSFNLDEDDSDGERKLPTKYSNGISHEENRDKTLTALIAQHLPKPQGAHREATTSLQGRIQKHMPKTKDDMAARNKNRTPYHMREQGPDRGGLAEREKPAGSQATLPEDSLMNRPSNKRLNGAPEPAMAANKAHIGKAMSTIRKLQTTMGKKTTGMSGYGEDDADNLNSAMLKSAMKAQE